jgi:hypothetical protein
MPELALGRLSAVLDLGVQLRLHPDSLVRDPLSVGLGLADQGREAPAQLGGRLLVEAVIDLAGRDQVIVLAAADIDAVPIVAVERKARDGQRLALGAGFLDPSRPRPDG